MENAAAYVVDWQRALRRVRCTVAHFWRWAFSDLRDNTTRGILAEFLAAKR
jgi:hypothetical protein